MSTIRISLLFLLLLTFTSCKKEGKTQNTVTPAPVLKTAKLINLPDGWKYASLLSSAFPDGVELYYFDSLFQGRKTKAFCLAYDSKKTFIEFKPVLSSTAKRVSDFYKDETGVVYGCINGGYFGSNQSYSLVQFNNAIQAVNIKSVSRSLNGVSTSYFPTRAAFGITSSGSPVSAWVYHVGPGNDNIFAYPSPSPNAEGKSPQPVPTETFPSGGTKWSTISAIGGSPMLLKGGNVTISDTEELININNTSPRPRTAIGFNNSSIVMLLAVEGDNSAGGYPGLNLLELANMLKALSCVEAVNLDGGGSSNMVVANQLLLRPGDNGVERPVVSAVLIKQK